MFIFLKNALLFSFTQCFCQNICVQFSWYFLFRCIYKYINGFKLCVLNLLDVYEDTEIGIIFTMLNILDEYIDTEIDSIFTIFYILHACIDTEIDSVFTSISLKKHCHITICLIILFYVLKSIYLIITNCFIINV